MTVQELINELNQIEDKSQRVIFECIGNRNVYDVNEIVGANIPKDDSCKEYERGILISNVQRLRDWSDTMYKWECPICGK